MTNSDSSGGSIIPVLRYDDAPGAIEWLCEAFGFERRLVVPGEGDSIRHAQLTLGRGMIMVGTRRDGEGIDVPARIGVNTQSNYVVVGEPDAHYARARAAGARILVEIGDQEDRGRFYSCADPGGHIWNFGEYDPWSGR